MTQLSPITLRILFAHLLYNKTKLITLLNDIYKIVAKTIADIMRLLLPSIIHDTQSGFLQDRSIFDNIFLFWEMTALAKHHKQSLAILLLDFEKAYDKVDWTFWRQFS